MLELDVRNAGFTERKDILQEPEIKKRHRQPTAELELSLSGENAAKRLRTGTKSARGERNQ